MQVGVPGPVLRKAFRIVCPSIEAISDVRQVALNDVYDGISVAWKALNPIRTPESLGDPDNQA